MSETLEFLGNMGLMEAVKLSTILLGCISAGALLFYVRFDMISRASCRQPRPFTHE